MIAVRQHMQTTHTQPRPRPLRPLYPVQLLPPGMPVDPLSIVIIGGYEFVPTPHGWALAEGAVSDG